MSHKHVNVHDHSRCHVTLPYNPGANEPRDEHRYKDFGVILGWIF